MNLKLDAKYLYTFLKQEILTILVYPSSQAFVSNFARFKKLQININVYIQVSNNL